MIATEKAFEAVVSFQATQAILKAHEHYSKALSEQVQTASTMVSTTVSGVVRQTTESVASYFRSQEPSAELVPVPVAVAVESTDCPDDKLHDIDKDGISCAVLVEPVTKPEKSETSQQHTERSWNQTLDNIRSYAVRVGTSALNGLSMQTTTTGVKASVPTAAPPVAQPPKVSSPSVVKAPKVPKPPREVPRVWNDAKKAARKLKEANAKARLRAVEQAPTPTPTPATTLPSLQPALLAGASAGAVTSAASFAMSTGWDAYQCSRGQISREEIMRRLPLRARNAAYDGVGAAVGTAAVMVLLPGVGPLGVFVSSLAGQQLMSHFHVEVQTTVEAGADEGEKGAGGDGPVRAEAEMVAVLVEQAMNAEAVTQDEATGSVGVDDDTLVVRTRAETETTGPVLCEECASATVAPLSADTEQLEPAECCGDAACTCVRNQTLSRRHGRQRSRVRGRRPAAP